ncbi:MAG: lamin tail domain-containing protein [Candidatus Eisenbacteria bacterium]
MRLVHLASIAALALTFNLPAGATPACADGMLQLNEILAGPARDWDGSGAFSSRDDEWVEVINSGTSSLVLDGFLISDADSIPRYALTGTLAPGGVLLVTGKMSYDWEKLKSLPAFGLSLGNTGDSVILWKVTGPDTVVVDAYTFRSFESAADRSIGRAIDTHEWQLFDSLNPYTGTLTPAGNRCAPSPGAVNICGTTAALPSTWGALKERYR